MFARLSAGRQARPTVSRVAITPDQPSAAAPRMEGAVNGVDPFPDLPIVVLKSVKPKPGEVVVRWVIVDPPSGKTRYWEQFTTGGQLVVVG